MTGPNMASQETDRVTRSMVGKGVSLNTASVSQMTTVALISEEDATKITQLRGENGELNLATLLAETSIDVVKLKQLIAKGILEALFEDEEVEVEDQEEEKEESQEQVNADVRELVATVAIQLEGVNQRLGNVEYGLRENGRGLKETRDGLHDLYERQCAWEVRQGKAQEEQGKAIDNILARLGWLEFKEQKKEDMKSRNKTQGRETEGRWSGGQEHRGVGGKLRENGELRTSTPRQVLVGGSSDTDGEPCVLMQPGMRNLLNAEEIAPIPFEHAPSVANLYREETMRSTRGVHFSQDTSQKVTGGNAYRGEAARGELPSVYGHQARPQLSERTDLGFRDGPGQVPFGAEGLLGTTNMAWRDGDKQKRYPPVTKKSRGHKLGKLPEQQPTSAWSWGKTDTSYRSLGERSSQLQNSRLSSSDESSDDDEEEESFSRKHRKPPQPKMPMFDGKSSEWGPFLFQFRKMAKIGRWTEKEKRDSLLACLRGKAITYIQTKPKYFRTSYESLKSLLEQRYGMTELPATARRQLSSMKQEEGETLEDFADRMIGKTGEGYLGVPEETLQVLATEAFLRGCRDRNAAYAASERKPETLCKAVEEMRDAAANLKAFNRGSLTARQVTFVDSEDEQRSSREGRKSRRDQDNILSQEQMALVKYMTELFSKNMGGNSGVSRSTSPAASGGRARSPSPARGECYKCGKPGHFARECKQESVCYNCGKTGHFAGECPKKRSSSPSSGYKGSGSQDSSARARQNSGESGSDLNSSGEGSSA